MARLRKFVSYRNIERAYTRTSKYTSKAYVKASLHTRIAQFDMGNRSRNDFDEEIVLVSKEDHQIRDNALESARKVVNVELKEKLSLANYFFKLKVYPHQILRENPLATGAGADRLSTGMKMSFGKPIGRAVRATKGKELFSLHVMKKDKKIAKKYLKKAVHKLPGTYRVVSRDNL